MDILNGIDLVIEDGQFLAITGPSGSGKTTLLSLIAGLDAPTGGSILIDGQDITRLNEDELASLRGKRFGFVFQNFHLIPTLTAIENVALATELNGGENAFGKAEAILDQVGLADRRSHYPSQLSGGEQQRLSLARAFVNQPDIVLADEPTGNLDSKNSAGIMKFFDRLNREGNTIILITHDQEVAAHASRTIRMKDGYIESDRSS